MFKSKLPSVFASAGSRIQVIASYLALGAVLMVVFMHPLIEGIHLWRTGQAAGDPWADLIVRPLRAAFRADMIPMTFALAVWGMVIGLPFALLHLRQIRLRRRRAAPPLDSAALRKAIAHGESEHLEFKSSLRWDWKHGKTNKHLMLAVAKSIAGLMNHEGGRVIIGIADDGEVKGIEADYRTMKRSNWDGFEQAIMALVADHMGARNCMYIHCHRQRFEGRDICQLVVEASPTPVYCVDGGVERYYVRAGNTTRDLDAREAVGHISSRQGVA